MTARVIAALFTPVRSEVPRRAPARITRVLELASDWAQATKLTSCHSRIKHVAVRIATLQQVEHERSRSTIN